MPDIKHLFFLAFLANLPQLALLADKDIGAAERNLRRAIFLAYNGLLGFTTLIGTSERLVASILVISHVYFRNNTISN